MVSPSAPRTKVSWWAQWLILERNLCFLLPLRMPPHCRLISHCLLDILVDCHCFSFPEWMKNSEGSDQDYGGYCLGLNLGSRAEVEWLLFSRYLNFPSFRFTLLWLGITVLLHVFVVSITSSSQLLFLVFPLLRHCVYKCSLSPHNSPIVKLLSPFSMGKLSHRKAK